MKVKVQRAGTRPRQDEEPIHRRAGAKYVGDFVFGALDGSITTFAIVAGAAGATLGPAIVLVLGFANLFGDGASMALGNYLGTKSETEYRLLQRKREEWETENIPDREREEIRQIYYKKGFRGEDLDRAVEIITSDKKTWIDTMMLEELNVVVEDKSPLLSGLATFVAFVSIGLIPLLAYVGAFISPTVETIAFPLAIIMTFTAIFAVGSARTLVTGKRWWTAGIEMTVVGGAAAFIAYSIGNLIGTAV